MPLVISLFDENMLNTAKINSAFITQETRFYHASSYASAALAAVILSVHLSVTHMLADKTKQCTADILIPHKTAITLVF